MITLLAALLQAAAWGVVPDAPTVGDTVRLVRRIASPPGVQARLRSLDPSPAIEPLAGPEASYAAGSLTIIYTVAAFEPGTHGLTMPVAELLHPDGRVESVSGGTAVVRVRSVLPAGVEQPQPQPSLAPLPRSPTSPVPLLTLVGTVLGVVVLWGMLRRRTRPRPALEPVPAERADVPIDRWVAAGEARAVAAVTTQRVRARIAELVPGATLQLDTDACLRVLRNERPEWPIAQLTDLLRSLERARFAPVVPSDVMIVVDQAELLLGTLGGTAAEAA